MRPTPTEERTMLPLATCNEEPEKVARVIAEALESESPGARYRVGRGVGALIMMSALAPAKYFDLLLRRVVG